MFTRAGSGLCHVTSHVLVVAVLRTFGSSRHWDMWEASSTERFRWTWAHGRGHGGSGGATGRRKGKGVLGVDSSYSTCDCHQRRQLMMRAVRRALLGSCRRSGLERGVL